MPATSAPSVHDLRAEFESILANVMGEEGRSMTADTMERRLLRQLLALGCQLLALFLATRAAATAGRAHRDAAGVDRPYHSERARHYLSIFGLIVFARPYFYGRSVGGIAPVDAQLRLPATACSDLVRESVEELAADLPYHKATGMLRRWFGLALSSRLVQEQLAEDAPEVVAFSAQQAPPPVAEEASILVMQADGKGVPILRPATTPAPVRLGKGQKYGGKKHPKDSLCQAPIKSEYRRLLGLCQLRRWHAVRRASVGAKGMGGRTLAAGQWFLSRAQEPRQEAWVAGGRASRVRSAATRP